MANSKIILLFSLILISLCFTDANRWTKKKEKKEEPKATGFENLLNKAQGEQRLKPASNAAVPELGNLFGDLDVEAFQQSMLKSMTGVSEMLNDPAKRGMYEAILRGENVEGDDNALFQAFTEMMPDLKQKMDEDPEAFTQQMDEALRSMGEAAALLANVAKGETSLKDAMKSFPGMEALSDDDLDQLELLLKDPEYLQSQMNTLLSGFDNSDLADLYEQLGLGDDAAAGQYLDDLMNDPEIKKLLENPDEDIRQMYEELLKDPAISEAVAQGKGEINKAGGGGDRKKGKKADLKTARARM